MFPKMVWNGFSSVFCFENWFGTEFRNFFSYENGSEQNSEVFSLPKMVRNRFPRFYSFQMVRNGIPRVFLFWEMVRNRIPRFFSLAKQAEFRRKCRLFRLVPYSVKIIFLPENGNPTLIPAVRRPGARESETNILLGAKTKKKINASAAWLYFLKIVFLLDQSFSNLLRDNYF